VRPIDQHQLHAAAPPDQFWKDMAAAARHWLGLQDVQARDAVVVLPFAELLPLCRRALATDGQWMPRVETLRSLGATLGPPPVGVADMPSGDRAIDRLLAERWMTSLPGLKDWRRRDPRACEQATVDIVEAAHALMRASAAQPPPSRPSWWVVAAEALQRPDGPGAVEAALGRVALQWAAMVPESPSDRLFSWSPSAWIVLEAGGADPVAEALLGQASLRGVPCLRLKADAPSPDPFDELAHARPNLWSVESSEDEAWAAAAATLDAVEQGHTPVALIAQDRQLVRRVRALLERRGLMVADESGWALSTTRAASHLIALLKAARPGAGPDAWLDGLKACVGAKSAPWLDKLERQWRRAGAEAEPGPELADAMAHWAALRARWQDFAGPPRQALKDWLGSAAALADELLPTDFWRGDPAAARVREALRLDQGSVRGDVDTWSMRLDEFIDWTQQVLEQATYVPPPGAHAEDVVITPLARAMLRPFATVVLPGADERQLGPLPAAPVLLPEAALRALGMDDREQRLRRATLAFTQLLRHSRLILLRRRSEGGEPLGCSQWVDRLQAARADRGLPSLDEVEAPGRSRLEPARPVIAPAARAQGALPDKVSASGVEALRACPYRFFARSVLRLSEAEELEADPGKRDFGSLLHDALHRFHDAAVDGESAEQQFRRLLATAREVAQDARLDGPAMLPFAAGLADFAERYLLWHAAREADGWRYEAGEVDITVDAEGIPGLQLRGRIDRIDRLRGGSREVIDYKTGGVAGLQEKVRVPLEDTQLAFYAAQLMLAGDTSTELSAAYLALDDREGIKTVPHPDVKDSAVELLRGLARDWQRLRDGQPLLALGEGAVCDTCEARGLCRRDHWADASTVGADLVGGGL
jgi:ATP-dependent helicase/nuclease subunit B